LQRRGQTTFAEPRRAHRRSTTRKAARNLREFPPDYIIGALPLASTTNMMTRLRSLTILAILLVFTTEVVAAAFNHSRLCISAFLPRTVVPRSIRTVSTPLWSNTNIAHNDGPEDAVRVQIWRALASGEELSLTELSRAVGERRRGELLSHLIHVEKQAKTLANKSEGWRLRRGVSPDVKRKVQLKRRRGAKNEVFVRIG